MRAVQNDVPLDPGNSPGNLDGAIPRHSPKFPVLENHLSEKQKAAIELLILGKSFTATTQTLGIDRKTLYNWRQDDEFCTELDRRRDELWFEAGTRLGGLVHPSLDILEEQLADGYDKVRYRAAAAILRLSDIRKSVPVS